MKEDYRYKFNKENLRYQILPKKGEVMWYAHSDGASRFIVDDSWLSDGVVYVSSLNELVMNELGEKVARKNSMPWYYKEGYRTLRSAFNKEKEDPEGDYSDFDVDKHFDKLVRKGSQVRFPNVSDSSMSIDRPAPYTALVTYISELKKQIKTKEIK